MRDARTGETLCNALALAALLTLGVMLPRDRPAGPQPAAARTAGCRMNAVHRVLQCPRVPEH